MPRTRRPRTTLADRISPRRNLLATLLLLAGCGDAGTEPTTTSAPTPAEGIQATAPAASNPASTDSLAPILHPSGSVAIRPGATEVYGEPSDVDFGIVPPGSKLRTVMKLVNPTDRPVVIRAAMPTCQCTTVQVAGETIPPKGAIGIPMTLQVPSTTGEKKAAVNIVFAPQVRGPRLTLRAVSAYPVQARASSVGPETLWIDALKPEGMTGRIRLVASDDRPFNVLSVNGAPPSFIGSSTASTEQVVAYDLTGETQASMPKWMMIETDHPEAPMLEMRVRHRWSMLPHQFKDYTVKVQFDGYIANVGRLAPGSTAEFTVELKQFRGRTLQMLRSGDPRFEVMLLSQTQGDGDRVKVVGALRPKADVRGPFTCPVVFVTPEGVETMYVIGTVR